MQGTRQILWGMLCILLVAVGYVLLNGLKQPFDNPIENQIFQQLRLPLAVTAVIVGSALSVSSACLQVILRNPLADPGIIGITSGASLFAAVFILAGSQITVSHMHIWLPVFCFIGAVASTVLIYLLARRLPEMGSAVILAGIAISTLSGALIAWMYLFSDAQSMRNLTFWLMGSLHQADWQILIFAMPVWLVLMIFVLGQSKQLNWFYFGANNAQLAGMNVKRFNRRMLLACALLVGIAVSIAGSIAFVGLLVPHLLRNFFGYDNRFILPASALCGGLLLMSVVIVSDTFVGINIPVSMLTATIGGPVFFYSLLRLQRKL